MDTNVHRRTASREAHRGGERVIKLKPCPFCGEKAKTYTLMQHYVDTADVVKRWKVMCAKDCCRLANDFSSEEEATREWNRRYQS